MGVVEGLDEFTSIHKLVVGRSMVDAEHSKWSVPVLVVNSNSYAVTIPAWMAVIAQVVMIQNVISDRSTTATPRVPDHVGEI